MASVGVSVALRQIHDLFSVGTVASHPDARLLDSFAQSRDETAFGALVERHGPMVLGVCRAVLKDEHAAEDAFQAAFLVLAKKAGVIRSGETLAAWLCRVAFRIAIQSSRQTERRRRREATAMSIARLIKRGPEPDVLVALHEELDQLPERLRVPVVLCHLEGKSYEQAAQTLRVPAATIRGRLVRARDCLAVRLSRRGISSAGAAIATALAAQTAKAAVPKTLADETLRAVVRGSASATAASLATAYMSTLVATKAIVFAAATMLAGGMLLFAVRTNPSKTEPPNSAPIASMLPLRKTAVSRVAYVPDQPKAADSNIKDDDAVEVSGRVLSPSGQPVPNALVKTAFGTAGKHEPAETSADFAGQFRLRILRSTRDMIIKERAKATQYLVASAPGFGISSTKIDLQVAAEVIVRLNEAGPPIEGRILDLEGRPVAGTQIKANQLWCSTTGDLKAWASKLNSGDARALYDGLKLLVGDVQTTADKDGKFKLEGLGPERVVNLVVSGPTIATEQFIATNHPGPELRLVREGFQGTETTIIHPSGFNIAAAPTKIVEGIVRDKDTGKPIAGVNIQGAVYDPQSLIPNHHVSVLTDAEGHYKLVGLSRSNAYRIFVYPGMGIPYARAVFRASADTPALDPTQFDFALKKGVVVKGRLLDKVTRKPIPIERVNACSFAENPYVEDYPGYKDSDMTYGRPDAEGGFEVVCLPGRGLLGVRAESSSYLKPEGVEKIKGYDEKYKHFNGVVPRMIPVVNYHALVETNFTPGTETIALDLFADPGRTVKLSVLDPEGQPLGGTTVNGAEGILRSWRGAEHASPEIEVKSLTASEPRRVTVRHAGRKLIGSVVLKGDEPSPVTLKLQPWAELKGRIVDDEGQPRSRLGLAQVNREKPNHALEEVDILPGSDVGGGISLDKHGAFHVVGLVPGLYYGADAEEKGYLLIGHLFDDVKLEPGQVKDLGDLKVVKYKEGN